MGDEEIQASLRRKFSDRLFHEKYYSREDADLIAQGCSVGCRYRRECADALKKPYISELDLLFRIRNGHISLEEALKAGAWLQKRESYLLRLTGDFSNHREISDETLGLLRRMAQEDRIRYWLERDTASKFPKMPVSVMSRDFLARCGESLLFEAMYHVLCFSPKSLVPVVDTKNIRIGREAEAFCVSNRLIDGENLLMFGRRYGASDKIMDWVRDDRMLGFLNRLMKKHRRSIELSYLNDLEDFARNHKMYTVREIYEARYHAPCPWWCWCFHSGFRIMNLALEHIYRVRRNAVLKQGYDPMLNRWDLRTESDLIQEDLKSAEGIVSGVICVGGFRDDWFTLPFEILTEEEARDQSYRYQQRFRSGEFDESKIDHLPDDMKAWLDPGHIMTRDEYDKILSRL